MKKVVPIVFSANAKYAPYVAVTINSIISNSSKDRFYKFFILQTELSSATILRLEDLKGENYSTKCINVAEYTNDSMYVSAYFSVEMYYRIMIPELFPEYDKVLYLDCDTVVVHDIAELYDENLGDCLIGAIRNLMHEKMRKYIEFSLKVDTDKYINSGVILFNCKKCREEKFTKKSFEMLEYRQEFRYPDQDLINVMCENRIKLLNPRWNFTWHYRHLAESKNTELHLSDIDMKLFYEYEEDPYIIHYTGEVKPWNNVNKYLSDYFWKYAMGTNFCNLFLNRLINDNAKVNRMYSSQYNEIKRDLVECRAIKAEIKKLKEEINFSASQSQPNVVYCQNEYLDKYNELLASKSYKLGRILTFPVRSVKGFVVSLFSVGLIETLRVCRKKMKLYKNIILHKKYEYA